jgi:hypothetical protein
MSNDIAPKELNRWAREAAYWEALCVGRDMRAAQERHFLRPTSDSRAEARALEIRVDKLIAQLPLATVQVPK